MHLLDVGCGPGTLSIDLARHVAPGRVLGVDLDPSVVAEATRTAAGSGLDISFVAGDFAGVDTPTVGFDVVHAHQVLQHVGDPVGHCALWLDWLGGAASSPRGMPTIPP